MTDESLKVSKNTQKFISDISNLSTEKYNKVVNFLDKLKDQQEAEAHLENKRGWRYMWQRTPKPYLLMLGYLVFLAPVGGVGYNTFSNVTDSYKVFYLSTLTAVLLLPLFVVFYLSYKYSIQQKQDHKDEQ